MKNQPENELKSKFRFLNSQEDSEEIIMSCSDSSEYENIRRCNLTVNRKRKRVKTRRKMAKNISKLNITYDSARPEHINEETRCPSPVFQNGSKVKNSNEIRTVKSPILFMKHTSTKILQNAGQKFFNDNNIVKNVLTSKEDCRSKSPVFNCSQIYKKSKLNSYTNNFESDDVYKGQSVHTGKENLKDSTLSNNITRSNIGKIKSYFDGQFSSDTTSQSISQFDTPQKNSSNTSEEIEIINSQIDKICEPQTINLENGSSSDSLHSGHFRIEKSKKIRYKKTGLAYRLRVLLNKQKANLCLWQHERFMAANSNFVIPNDNFTPFLIQNVSFKYGCYLLEVMDVEEKRYIALINYLYMNSNSLEQSNVLKLYRPYHILDFNPNYQLIVNITKFECTAL